MMYARTESMYAVLLVASFLIEGSQATHQMRAATPTLVSTSASASATAVLSFHTLPEPTTCTSTTFSWSYSGPEQPLLLQVTNVGVTQGGPPITTNSSTTSASTTSSSTESSIATTRNVVRAPPDTPISLPNLTVTLITNLDPSALSYVWDNVNVPQGWYSLSATISTDPKYQTSSFFYVHTGSNISCLTTGVISPTNSHTPTITRSASSSLSSRPATSLPISGVSSSSSAKIPTIVGVTVGMVFLVLGLLMLWFIFVRKRKSRTIDGGYVKNSFNRWKSSRDSRGGFDANVAHKRYRSSRSHLTSQLGSMGSTFGPEYEDGVSIGAEKKSPDEHGVALSTLPVLQRNSSRSRPNHTHSPSSSSANVNEYSVRYSNQHSIDSSAVYAPESGQGSDILRSHSLSTTGTQNSLLHSNSVDPTLVLPPSISLTNKQSHRQSLGKKRKPAPVYKPSEDGHGPPLSSSSTTSAAAIVSTPPVLQHSTSTNMEPSFPELSHKNSFGPGGIEGKPLHYLIPDMPLSQKTS